MKVSLGKQLRALARRSVVRTLKDPANIVPTMMVPLLLFAVVSAGLSKATQLPGFPTDSAVTFALAIAFLQGAMMNIANMGQEVATDIETGFMDRLALTPLRGAVLIISQLAGCLALGIIQAAVYLGVGYAAGARAEAGVTGVVVLVGLFLASVIGFGAMGIFVGIRTGSGQAVQAVAPLASVFLFLSSVIFPRNLIEEDWFRWVATVNPISYLAEGLRSVLIVGWDVQALALGFAIAFGLTFIMILASVGSLGGRLVRT
jgi:ABC-2 type transport system permease protein